MLEASINTYLHDSKSLLMQQGQSFTPNQTLTEVNRLAKHQVHLLCSCKHGDSILRLSDVNAVKRFSWVAILRELQLKSPTVYSLKAVLQRHKHKVHCWNVGMSASVLLESHNKHLGLVQGVISLLMCGGHSSKQVIVTSLKYCMYVILCTV